jgi:hypothetical protein
MSQFPSLPAPWCSAAVVTRPADVLACPGFFLVILEREAFKWEPFTAARALAFLRAEESIEDSHAGLALTRPAP